MSISTNLSPPYFVARSWTNSCFNLFKHLHRKKRTKESTKLLQERIWTMTFVNQIISWIQFTKKVLNDLNNKNTHFLYKELDLNLKMSKEGECGTWTIKTFGNTTNSYLWTKKTSVSVFSNSQNVPPEFSTPGGGGGKNPKKGGSRERKEAGVG